MNIPIVETEEYIRLNNKLSYEINENVIKYEPKLKRDIKDKVSLSNAKLRYNNMKTGKDFKLEREELIKDFINSRIPNYNLIFKPLK